MHLLIRRTTAYAEWNSETDESYEGMNYAHLDYPCRCLLLTPQYPFRPNNAGVWVYGAVHDVDGYYMGAVLIGIFMPHPDDDVNNRLLELNQSNRI